MLFTWQPSLQCMLRTVVQGSPFQTAMMGHLLQVGCVLWRLLFFGSAVRWCTRIELRRFVQVSCVLRYLLVFGSAACWGTRAGLGSSAACWFVAVFGSAVCWGTWFVQFFAGQPCAGVPVWQLRAGFKLAGICVVEAAWFAVLSLEHAWTVRVCFFINGVGDGVSPECLEAVIGCSWRAGCCRCKGCGYLSERKDADLDKFAKRALVEWDVRLWAQTMLGVSTLPLALCVVCCASCGLKKHNLWSNCLRLQLEQVNKPKILGRADQPGKTRLFSFLCFFWLQIFFLILIPVYSRACFLFVKILGWCEWCFDFWPLLVGGLCRGLVLERNLSLPRLALFISKLSIGYARNLYGDGLYVKQLFCRVFGWNLLGSGYLVYLFRPCGRL